MAVRHRLLIAAAITPMAAATVHDAAAQAGAARPAPPPFVTIVPAPPPAPPPPPRDGYPPAPPAPPAPPSGGYPPAPPAPPVPPRGIWSSGGRLGAGPFATHSLRNANLYIYNFLDFRGELFGPRMIEQIDRQLNARLNENGVRTQGLLFRDMRVMLGYTNKNPYGPNFNSVPLPEAVDINLRQERSFGAQYRLAVIPTNFVRNGSWQEYDISWMLIDAARGGEVVWSHVTHNRRMVIFRADEDAERRGRALVDEVIAALLAAQLI